MANAGSEMKLTIMVLVALKMWVNVKIIRVFGPEADFEFYYREVVQVKFRMVGSDCRDGGNLKFIQ